MIDDLAVLTREEWYRVVPARESTHAEPPLSLRSDTRYRLQTGAAELLYHGPSGRPMRCIGLPQDVSRTGVMVKTTVRIRERIPVLLRLVLGEKTYVLAAEVRHCSTTPGGFKVGCSLLFEDEFADEPI